MTEATAVVLAAGKGTRMKSDLPKVLFPVCGRPMIEFVLDALSASGVGRVLAVVGYRADLVRETIGSRAGIEFVEQTEQLGTGHAVMMCREKLQGYNGPVLIVTGDSPLAQSSSLKKLLAEYEKTKAACLIGTIHKPNPTGLGRIVRDSSGAFSGIVEEKDATDEQKKITEVNMSTYVFHGPDLLKALDQLTTNNAQREYYITDCPGLLLKAGQEVRALPVLEACEALSINTIDELGAVEAEMRRRNL